MRSFIWDLDGTLLDSYGIIVDILQETFREMGATVEKNEIKNYIIRNSVHDFIIYMCSNTGYTFENVKATPHKDRLTALHASCLHIFRHIAQILLDRRQPACVEFIQSDEKSDCAIHAQSLCGVALKKIFRDQQREKNADPTC